MEPSVIMMEFNELTPSLLERFMKEGKLPNFKRLHAESRVFLTHAQEEPPYLEPWIQWVTVHSGLPYAEHRVFHLGEGHKLSRPCVWDILAREGFRVWICGSMNVRCDLPLNGFLLPDPWTTAFAPHPDVLLPYFRFVQANVMEYTNERLPLRWKDYLQFLGFMASHGLSLRAARSAARSLLSAPAGRWKGAFTLDKLQFDLFRHVYRKMKPHFSTFFSNSTAHCQHLYWRNMEPQLFKKAPSAAEQAEFEQAVLTSYVEMDKLVGDFIELAGGDTALIFCTALSQQPCVAYEDQGGKSFYRPRDFEKLLRAAGIDGSPTVSPVMAEQFYLYFESERDAIRAQERLLGLRVGGRPAMITHCEGSRVFSGCGIFEELPFDADLTLGKAGPSAPFFELFYKVSGLKSGMHHPDGMLWIREPGGNHCVHEEKIPLTSIAPTILEMFSAPRPHFMPPPLSDCHAYPLGKSRRPLAS